jgi:hypothetical protein
MKSFQKNQQVDLANKTHNHVYVIIYQGKEEDCKLDVVPRHHDNWTWKQMNKLLKDMQKTILKMERSMQGL